MKMFETAPSGKHFVYTAKGYTKMPEGVKSERAVGRPIMGFESRVPVLWAKEGWVELEEQGHGNI